MRRSRLTVLPLLFAAAASAQTTQPSVSPMTPAGGTPPMMAPVSPPAAPATSPATNPADAAAAVAVHDALVQYNAAVAAGDVDKLQSFVAAATGPQKAAIALMGRLTTSGHGVYAATVAKFGEPDMAKNNVDRTSFPAGFPSMPLDNLDIKVAGDKATLTARGAEQAPPLAMTRKDGVWKIDGDALLPAMTDKQLKDQSTVLDAAIAAIDQTAGDVTAGHFRAPDEAIVIMNARVQKAVRAAQMTLAPMPDPSMPQGAGPTTAPAAGQMAP